jgi:hypothetical protein
MDSYTRYYFEQSDGGGFGPVYRVQIGHGIGPFFKGLFRFFKALLFSGAKTVGKEALKTAANILRDIIQRKPHQKEGWQYNKYTFLRLKISWNKKNI